LETNELKKVDKETAELEYLRFAELWEIDDDVENMKEEDAESYGAQKAKVMNSIERGRLMINDEGILTYYFKEFDKVGCESVEIHRPGGAALMAMDRAKDRENIKKIFSSLAAMTKKDASFFSRMDGIDLKPFMAIYSLFLNS
jgi:hypothetical protein